MLGQTVSGTIVDVGWVLTPQPKTIPNDGSTIKLYIDGALLSGASQYNRPRPDAKRFFPWSRKFRPSRSVRVDR